MTAILNSIDGRRPKMSGNVDSVISKSGLVENVGVEVKIACISQAVQKLLQLPFLRPPSWTCGFRLHVTAMAVAPYVGFLDLENRVVAVGILILCAQNSRYIWVRLATPLCASRQ